MASVGSLECKLTTPLLHWDPEPISGFEWRKVPSTLPERANMESFVGIKIAGGLFVLTLVIALLVYRRSEKKRRESSFFSPEFRGTFLGAETVFGVAVVAVGLMADLYVTSQLVAVALLVAGTIGQYVAHKRIIRWAHRVAGKDRMVKGTRPRRHMRARA